MLSKKCSSCLLEKDINKFSKKKASYDGHHTKCKDCHNKYVREVWYPNNKEKHLESVSNYKKNNENKVRSYSLGVELSQVDDLFKTKKVCFVCESTFNICIDHCHITNNIRGWLCNNCNLAIGLLGDTFERVMLKLPKIEEYLKK